MIPAEQGYEDMVPTVMGNFQKYRVVCQVRTLTEVKGKDSKGRVFGKGKGFLVRSISRS